MKTKFALIFTLMSICLISGCYRYAHLYPIQGPLASLTPPPIYTAKITGAWNSGNLSVTLANGEVFSGPWKEISVKARTQSAAAGVPVQFNLASAWDAVYGQGFYTAHVLGTPLFVQAVLTGNQGTVLQVEMYRQEHGSDTDPNSAAPLDIKGVAKDSNGNIFKMAF
ncbi:MAG: hypothetical protein WCA89_02285 [Terracidiphilus sp.]